MKVIEYYDTFYLKSIPVAEKTWYTFLLVNKERSLEFLKILKKHNYVLNTKKPLDYSRFMYLYGS